MQKSRTSQTATAAAEISTRFPQGFPAVGGGGWRAPPEQGWQLLELMPGH